MQKIEKYCKKEIRYLLYTEEHIYYNGFSDPNKDSIDSFASWNKISDKNVTESCFCLNNNFGWAIFKKFGCFHISKLKIREDLKGRFPSHVLLVFAYHRLGFADALLSELLFEVFRFPEILLEADTKDISLTRSLSSICALNFLFSISRSSILSSRSKTVCWRSPSFMSCSDSSSSDSSEDETRRAGGCVSGSGARETVRCERFRGGFATGLLNNEENVYTKKE